jgi:hypothetical protein
MFWPMEVIFRDNSVTKEYIYDNTLSKISISEVNLQYHVIRYC